MSYFDRKGNEIDLHRFGQLWEDVSYRRVKEDVIGDYVVKTFWMGIDPYYMKKSIKDKDLPEIFETMIFSKNKEDDLHNRYVKSCDEYSCLNNHDKMCELCTKKSIKLPTNIISSDQHIERAIQQENIKRNKK